MDTMAVTTVTTSTTLDTNFAIYIADASGGGMTLTLPNIPADGLHLQVFLHRGLL
jgi:hypothetical protein